MSDDFKKAQSDNDNLEQPNEQTNVVSTTTTFGVRPERTYTQAELDSRLQAERVATLKMASEQLPVFPSTHPLFVVAETWRQKILSLTEQPPDVEAGKVRETALRREWELERRMCSVCCGKSLPTDKPGCICGGIGTEIAEATGLRQEIFKMRYEQAEHDALLVAGAYEAASLAHERLARLTASVPKKLTGVLRADIAKLTPADARAAIEKVKREAKLEELDGVPHYLECATLLVTRDPYPPCNCWVGYRIAELQSALTPSELHPEKTGEEAKS